MVTRKRGMWRAKHGGTIVIPIYLFRYQSSLHPNTGILDVDASLSVLISSCSYSIHTPICIGLLPSQIESGHKIYWSFLEKVHVDANGIILFNVQDQLFLGSTSLVHLLLKVVLIQTKMRRLRRRRLYLNAVKKCPMKERWVVCS